ncbi:MAG: carboxypeptidase-like regulatory domain-containing protein, partial [Paludibacter sp.]
MTKNQFIHLFSNWEKLNVFLFQNRIFGLLIFVGLVAFSTNAYSQTNKPQQPDQKTNQTAAKKISGKVTDEKGEPILGATVLVKGFSTGTITNAMGAFSLTLPANAKTLSLSYIGYKSQEIIVGNANVYNIVLEDA